MATPKRTFSADVGQKSIGTAGPDQIEYDLDNLFAALDPNDTFKDGTPGGINTENMRQGSVTDAIIGERTIDQNVATDGNTGSLTILLSRFAKHIKAVKGNVVNWFDTAVASISDIWAKFHASTGHKHTGAENDAPKIGASGLADGAATDAIIGNRTINQAQVPQDTGQLTVLLSSLANRIRAITGKPDWKTDPATTLETAKAHFDAVAPHSGHETPSGAQAKVDTHAGQTSGVHGVGTGAVVGTTLAQTLTNKTLGTGTVLGADLDAGNKKIINLAAPTSSNDAARKADVDAHANRVDNPHNTTAAQVGALVSIDGVSNPGGNVDLVAGTGITITPDNTGKKITITATGEALPAAHASTHASGGSDPVSPVSIGAVDLTTFNSHKSRHASGGADPLTPADIGAAPSSHTHTRSQITDFAHKSTHAIWGSDPISPLDIGAVRAGDFAQHLGETMITVDTTINVPNDYITIQAALDSLKKAWIPRDVTVTIQVAAGYYNHTSPIIIDHPQGLHIKIIGATPVTTTITGVGTITGAAGNWSVPILVQSTSGIAAGDYVIIRDTTGTGAHYAFRGIWKVVSVDSATQITVQNTHRASTFPTATLSGGTVVALKTILKFTACNGIVVAPNSALGLLDQVAVVGDGSINTGILVGRVPSNQTVPGPAFILLGSNVGVNGFGADGIWVGCGGDASAYSGVASSGNGGHGFWAVNSGSIWAGYSTASGNGSHGFWADNGGSIWAYYSTASGNGYNGFAADNGGSIWAGSSTAVDNKSRGFTANNGGTIVAVNSTASGNTNYDYYAWLESSIYAYGYTGTPTFSPAANTVGNANAIIVT